MASELTVGKIGVGIAPAHAATIYGTGAGNATVQIEGEGGADPTLNFLVNNATHWAIGADDSDSDSLKICQHSAVGSTNNFLTIDTTGIATFSGGIKSENGIYGGQITIADDAAGSITPPRQATLMTLSYNANGDYPSHWAGLLYCDVGLSVFNTVVASGGGPPTAVNTDVTGTTGANGATTVGGVAAAGTGQVGTIKIENRTSISVTYWYNFIG